MSGYSTNDLSAIYKDVIDAIRADRAITNDAVNLWFTDCRIKYINDDAVCLSVENDARAKMILTHYKTILIKYFSEELGRIVDVEVTSDKTESPDFSDDAEDGEFREDIKSEKVFKKANNYTFENFVVGSSNAFAYAAAKSISEKPSSEFNPFFVYGPSGIGKTHLLYAIANRILETHPEKVIIFLKGEDFTNALIDSLNAGTMNLFRQKYRSADVLIIDDIQFIAGKKQTQEEFFHTFDTLYENDKQIILSSDRSPSEISILEDRLKTRFSSGLIQDIQIPDLELRLAILRKKSENAGLRLSDEILEFLADKLHSNIREIEGVIKKLSAMYFLNGVEINMNTVKENVSVFLKEEEPTQLIVSRIISETGKKFNVPVEEILGRKRDKQIQLARNASMYIIRKITPLSLPEIGVMFERKHSSVKSNIDTLTNAIQNDVFLEKQVEEIINTVKH
ncbi:MAG: chromosomal replication initiator protein DnaA [Clostridia bacterium]|nr:chromosomal replication initiator protein DnaA [Clostridia bacterium]